VLTSIELRRPSASLPAWLSGTTAVGSLLLAIALPCDAGAWSSVAIVLAVFIGPLLVAILIASAVALHTWPSGDSAGVKVVAVIGSLVIGCVAGTVCGLITAFVAFAQCLPS
jgi:hypothetical protein